MKIDAIVMRELQMPLVAPFQTSFGTTTDRRILLVEVRGEGYVGWGECVAGEHPYFSEETIDTAWTIIESELAPLIVDSDLQQSGNVPRLFKVVRGNRMAKAAVENAIWDLEAQIKDLSLSTMLGGTRDIIACGVSIGIQPTMEQQLAKIEKELAAGYQRIKLKCKPGWDRKMLEAVRKRWPEILLSVDANSAYRLNDQAHLVSFDEFRLLMIEQPLWADDFYFHSMLQKQMETAIWMNPYATGATRWQPSRWSRAGSSTSSVGGSADSVRPSRCTMRLRSGALLSGAGGCWRRVSDVPTISRCRPWRTFGCPATYLLPAAIGRTTSSNRW
jgi:O-succinylbenzoate synthase